MLKFPTNAAKFAQVRQLGLPLGRYVITCSGPLGIRDLRAIGDIDIITDLPLWIELDAAYTSTTEAGFDHIRLGHIEIMGPGSILIPDRPGFSGRQQIADAQIIDGLPFLSLDRLLYLKSQVLPYHLGRPKDRADVRLIETQIALSRQRQPDAVTLNR